MTDTVEPKRHLDLEGSFNIRDIGGYETHDGRRTRWRTFLRSDSLHRIPAASRAALIDYGVRTVIDLRTTDALQDRPDVFAGSGQVRYLHHNMVGDDPLTGTAETTESIESGARWRAVSDQYSVILDHRRAQVCETVRTLAAPGTLPALVHCAGGKDRTGIITALVLELAGVPIETIAEDYAVSGRYLFARYIEDTGAAEVAASGYTWQDYRRECCPPEVMSATLQHLREHYDGVPGYLLGGGVTQGEIDELRAAVVD